MTTFAVGTGPVSQEMNDEVCAEFARLVPNLPSAEYTVADIAAKLALSEALVYCTIARSLIGESAWARKMKTAGVEYWRGVIAVGPRP